MIRSGSRSRCSPARWRTLAIAVTLLAACFSPPPKSPPNNFVAQFDAIWSRYDQLYPSFEYKRVDWSAMRAHYRPRAAAARTQDEFIAVARDMLDTLKDLHAWFVDPRGRVVPTYRPAATSNFDRERWQRALRDVSYTPHGTGWGEANVGGYGYLFIGTWNSSQVDVNALDLAMTRFRDAPGLIIDVRSNAGGSDTPAYQFAGRFATRPFVASYLQVRDHAAQRELTSLEARMVSPRGAWQYTRPVIVIAGRGAFSANESFVAAMRVLPQVMVIGDTTGGASGNPATFPLGNGWQFTVPRWIEYGPDRNPIEGRGVPPHVPIPWTPSLYDAERDPLIDAAVGMLAERNGVYRIAPATGRN